MAGVPIVGYNGYYYVHAPVFDGAEQQKRTTNITGPQVTKVLQDQPQVKALVNAVRQALGLPMPLGAAAQAGGKCIRFMHILKQDEAQQSAFSWHSDVYDIEAHHSRRERRAERGGWERRLGEDGGEGREACTR